eukprot:7993563-Pyramimonas_sp.AAC.2
MIVTDHTREGEEQASFLRLIDQVSDYHEFKEDMHEQLEIPSNLQVIFKLKMSLNNTGGVSMLKISGEKDWAATLPVLRSSVGANLEVHCAPAAKRSIVAGGLRFGSEKSKGYKVSKSDKIHEKLSHLLGLSDGTKRGSQGRSVVGEWTPECTQLMEQNPREIYAFDELRAGMQKCFPDGDQYVINPILMQCPFSGCH